jgi:hypothetical protein
MELSTSGSDHPAPQAAPEYVAPSDTTCDISDSASAAFGQTIGEGLDTLTIPVRAEELRPRLRRSHDAPVRVQKRLVREELSSDRIEGGENIQVSRQFVTRAGANGEPAVFEQIVIEIPLPAGMTPADLEADGAEQIVVTYEVIQRTARVSGTVRHEEVRIAGDDAVLNRIDGPGQR